VLVRSWRKKRSWVKSSSVHSLDLEQAISDMERLLPSWTIFHGPMSALSPQSGECRQSSDVTVHWGLMSIRQWIPVT